MYRGTADALIQSFDNEKEVRLAPKPCALIENTVYRVREKTLNLLLEIITVKNISAFSKTTNCILHNFLLSMSVIL